MGSHYLRQKYEKERIYQKKCQSSREDLEGSLRKYFGECADTLQDNGHLHDRFEQILSFFLPHYSKADHLALKYQSRYQKASVEIALLAACAILVVAIQAIFHLSHKILIVEILFLTRIVYIIVAGNRIGLRRRWIDYRLLAERFRCAIFLTLLGEKASKTFPPQDLHHDRNKERWFFSYFNEIFSQWRQRKKPFEFTNDHINVLREFIKNAWLVDQKRYHESKSEKHKIKHKRLSRLGWLLFPATIIIAIMHLLHIGGEVFAKTLILLAISLPAFGASFSALRTHFEHNKLAHQSHEMVNRLENIEFRLAKADKITGLIKISKDIELLMLNEISNWHVMISFHELEPPG